MSENTDDRSLSIGTTLLTAAAAFAGSIVGNGLRQLVRAKLEHDEKVRFGVPTYDDRLELTVSGVISNTVAATALAHTVSTRRALVGFLIGAGLSAATGDTPDRMIRELVATEPEGFVPMEGFMPMELAEEPEGV
jgi:phosphate/sulfate permease